MKKAAYPGLLQGHPHAHEALEYATRNDATTNAGALPLPSEKDVLTAALHHGATRVLAQAIQAEVEAYPDARSELRDEAGRHQVVRNGYLPERTITTGVGAVGVKQPRAHDRRNRTVANAALLRARRASPPPLLHLVRHRLELRLGLQHPLVFRGVVEVLELVAEDAEGAPPIQPRAPFWPSP